MADFEIFTDSSANIPNDLRKERNIHIISYICSVNGTDKYCFEDRPFEETAKRFYAEMRANADIKTSLIVEERFIEAITPSLEAGRDVIIVTIASGISGTYAQAVAAQKTLSKKYPQRKILVADSANASLGEGLLVLKVADLRDMGESIETCAEWVKNNAYKMNSFFTVDDLKYLRKGGRISRTLAIAGTLLSIKPILTADGSANAKISFFGKARGRKKAISTLVDSFRRNCIRPEGQTIAITHADCEEEALALAAELKELGARDVIVEYYDICTGTHVGPGTIALFFMGKDRRNETFAAEAVAQGKTVPSKL